MCHRRLCIAAFALAALVTPAASQAMPAPPAFELLVAGDAATGTLQMAVFRPRGAGPHPAVLILHGTHGFAEEYLALARGLADAGYVAVAACWFAGSSGAGAKFVTPRTCPDGTPSLVAAASDDAMLRIVALLAGVRKLPDVDARRIALFGHSRGGGAVLNYVLRRGNVGAAILNSAGYPDELTGRIDALATPLLILHGADDNPLDGGSPVTGAGKARQFAETLRRAGKPVEIEVYPGAGHNSLFSDARQHRLAVARMRAFLSAALAASRPPPR